MTDWDARFMDLSAHIATWSKDPSTRVGAVIVDHMKRVIATGYNGFPRGVRDTDERYADKPTKYAMVVHAEANAILSAVADVRGHTIYSTKAPCSACCGILIQAGIRLVVCQPWDDDGGKWAEDAKIARLMLEEARVFVHHPGKP